MSFNYSRPHSTDSWRSRRPSFELSSRMHSIPRYPKSPGRYTGTVAYPKDFSESPLYYMHRNDTSINRDSASPRRASYSDREKNVSSAKCTHSNYNQEMQRKMTFNLHEEAEKPYLTIILEEICDPERINDICLGTLTSMMKSKIYRKFLHHMNNNAIPSFVDCYNLTFNSKWDSKQVRQMDHERKSSTFPYERKQHSKYLQTSSHHDYSKFVKDLQEEQIYQQRALRRDEVLALEKLKLKLPTVKKPKKEREEVATTSSAVQSGISDNTGPIIDLLESHRSLVPANDSQEEIEEGEQSRPGPEWNPEEILKTKWLRLTDRQIAELEKQIRQTGKEPGIHHFTTINYDTVFND